MAMALRSEMLGPMTDMGRWDDVLIVADHLTKWSRTTGEGYFTIVAAVYRAHVLLYRGEVDQAVALAGGFMPAARGIADPQVVVEALAVAAFIERERGQLTTAIQLIEELERLTQARPTWFRAKELPELIRTCVAADAFPLAERLLQGLPVQATRHKLSFSTAEAVMREARGDHEGALDAYVRSSDAWRSFGHVLEEGRALLGAGRCLARLGRADAAERLTEARLIFESLGATSLVADAESWLGKAPVQIP